MRHVHSAGHPPDLSPARTRAFPVRCDFGLAVACLLSLRAHRQVSPPAWSICAVAGGPCRGGRDADLVHRHSAAAAVAAVQYRMSLYTAMSRTSAQGTPCDVAAMVCTLLPSRLAAEIWELWRVA